MEYTYSSTNFRNYEKKNGVIAVFFFLEGFIGKQQKTPKRKKSLQCYRALSDNYMENKMFISKNDQSK